MTQNLQFKPVADNSDLVSKSVFDFCVKAGKGKEILVAEIDPKYMGGEDVCREYGIAREDGANCVIIEAVKGAERHFVALVLPVGYRSDLNKFVRKYLGVKRVSLAPLEEVLEKTGMEYGSITPIGLSQDWKILIDSRLQKREALVMGSGRQRAKLLVPATVLFSLSNAKCIDGLGI